MRIFKYCDKGGLFILKDMELRLSLPDSFNDPFEFSPRLNLSDYPKEQWIEALKLEHMFHEWCGRQNRPCNKATRDYYSTHLSEIADEMMPNFLANIAREVAAFAQRTAQSWAVGCFSETSESILMWSHYADHHQGMVIGFDTDQEPFNITKQVAILKVCYGLSKVTYKHPFGGGKRFETAFHEVAAWKFKDWEYEKEVRILVPRGALRDGRFLRLSPSAIQTITLGCKSEPSLAAKVLDALRAPCFGHVKVYIAEQNQDEFKIDLKEIQRTKRPCS
ncbi:MAG: DUF2971 domain-containing protein [Verrucomicrobiia bacterium]|jgi:hypothetical protein